MSATPTIIAGLPASGVGTNHLLLEVHESAGYSALEVELVQRLAEVEDQLEEAEYELNDQHDLVRACWRREIFDADDMEDALPIEEFEAEKAIGTSILEAVAKAAKP